MVCDGLMQWPPKWLQTHGPRSIYAFGEVGILEEVFILRQRINKVYLLMNTAEGNSYIGILMFEHAQVAEEVYSLLLTCVYRRMKAVGALDLPETFGE